MLISRVNKLKDHKLELNVNGTDNKSYDSIILLGVDINNEVDFPLLFSFSSSSKLNNRIIFSKSCG